MKIYKGTRSGHIPFIHVVGGKMSFTFFKVNNKISTVYYCKLWADDMVDNDPPSDGKEISVSDIDKNELLQSVFESELAEIFRIKEVK